MARATAETKLSLYEFAKLVGINPLHFCGVEIPGRNIGCGQPILQHRWQTAERVSREEVADAIATAEATIEQHLGYRLLPAWETEEWRDAQLGWRRELPSGRFTALGRGKTVQAQWGYFITGGIERKDLLLSSQAITYNDTDGDGYEETAVVTFNSNVEPCEVELYYPGKAGDQAWQIRPITVSKVSDVVTITFRREQVVVEPIIEDLIEASAANGEDDDHFLTAADVYRHYNDPSTQVTLMWEGTGCSCGGVEGCSTCVFSVQYGCLLPRGNFRQSVLTYNPGTWNAETQLFDPLTDAFARQPEAFRLFYYAGLRNQRLTCPTRQMDPQMARIVAYFAASMLDRPMCGCGTDAMAKWTTDRALVTGSDGANSQTGVYSLSQNDLDNPFGTKEGAIYAWRRLKYESIGQAISV